jgi:CspA family cold shock protein
MRGRVLWFDDAKGYGFIRPDDPEATEDVYVHYSAIDSKAARRKLLEAQVVEFELVISLRGPQATNVRVVAP